MASTLSSEIKNLIAYVKNFDYSQLEKDLLKVERFLEDHAQDIIKLAKGAYQSAKTDSAKPLEIAIGQVAKFPANPNKDNVMDWIRNDLIPALEALLDHLKKYFPAEKKYIDIIEDVLKGIQNILGFIRKFV